MLWGCCWEALVRAWLGKIQMPNDLRSSAGEESGTELSRCLRKLLKELELIGLFNLSGLTRNLGFHEQCDTPFVSKVMPQRDRS